MGTRALLKEQFQDYGVDISGPVLDKCEEICLLHGVDAEGLVEAWMAFSLSNLAGAELTLDTLSQMERKEFGKKANRDAPPMKTSLKQTPKSSSLVIYNASGKDSVPEDDILNAYCTTPKSRRLEKRSAEHHTPEDHGAKRQVCAGRSPRMAFSPASFSPTVATPSSKYSTRANAGQIACEYGSRPPGLSWKARGPLKGLQVAPYSAHCQPPLPAEARYMYEKLQTKAAVLNDVVEWLGQQLVQKHNLSEPDHLKSLQTEPFVGFGRICCDANGRLNPSSVLLEGSRETSFGVSIPVKLGAVPTYALFPGQVVAMEGTNPTGEVVVAQKIYSDASLPLPSEPLRISTSEGPLHVVLAAGPFTQTDTMTYQPLEDLVMYAQEHEPHILILIGPFVDANHPQVQNNTLVEKFDDVFENIVKILMQPLARLQTQVVLVPSARDVHHQPVYPTPPYVLKKPQPNLHLMPDPCLLDINGIVVGITATDVLMHIGREEICNPPQGTDRLGRLASHLISQRSMYPLCPPAEELSVDWEMWDDHTHLPVTPHILILPSDFRYFLKNVNGCMVVNPERLAKGTAGGTFVRLEIKLKVDETGSIASNVSGQVVKI